MTAVIGHTQICRPRPGDRYTETEPLVPLSSKPAAFAAIALCVDGGHSLGLARSRYIKRYPALDP